MAENPYRLARDIRGIGFRTADAIAARLGIEPTAIIRLRAGIHYALLEASGDGHCGLPAAELLRLAGSLLAVERADHTGASSREPLEPGLIQGALDLELAEGAVVVDTLAGEAAIFLAHLHRDERQIAAALQELAEGAPPWGAIDSTRAIPWVEQQLGLQLATSQKAAVLQALSHRVLVITGGPGVGKTTLLNSILKIHAARKKKLVACAPTGRAAGGWPRPPVGGQDHPSLLEFNPATGGFRHDRSAPLAGDLLWSMNSPWWTWLLAWQLIRPCPPEPPC